MEQKRKITLNLFLLVSVLLVLTQTLIIPQVKAQDKISVSFLWNVPLDTHVRDLSIGDFDGDGINDVVASVVVWRKARWSIVAIRGLDGSALWTFSLNSKIGQIETGNLNDDSIDDVVAGSWDGNLYALSGKDGSVLWMKQLGKFISDLKIVDLDGDGIQEIIVAIDNEVIAFRRDGSKLWSFKENISSPVIALGRFNDDYVVDISIINRHHKKGQNAIIFALDGNKGDVMWKYTLPIFNISGNYLSTNDIATGDFNGDLRDDVAVVVGLNGSQLKTSYRVYAFKGSSGVVMWTFTGLMPAFGAGLA